VGSTTPADPTAHRRQPSAALRDGTGVTGADEVAVERLLLAFEEPASHGFGTGVTRCGRP
jgi:hypothetical protein